MVDYRWSAFWAELGLVDDPYVRAKYSRLLDAISGSAGGRFSSLTTSNQAHNEMNPSPSVH